MTGTSELAAARAWLTTFVEAKATVTAEFADCLVSGRPFRVATVNATPSIFLTAEANWAMRFWHDVTHVELGQGFDFAGESVVAAAHLRAVVGAGQPEGSVAWQLLRTDTVGQNLVYALTGGGFVPDQLAFSMASLRYGLPFAVLAVVAEVENREVNEADFDHLRSLLAAEVDSERCVVRVDPRSELQAPVRSLGARGYVR